MVNRFPTLVTNIITPGSQKHFLVFVYSPSPITNVNVIVLVVPSSLRIHSSLLVDTCHPSQIHSSWFGDSHHSPYFSTIVHNTRVCFCLSTLVQNVLTLVCRLPPRTANTLTLGTNTPSHHRLGWIPLHLIQYIRIEEVLIKSTYILVCHVL